MGDAREENACSKSGGQNLKIYVYVTFNGLQNNLKAVKSDVDVDGGQNGARGNGVCLGTDVEQGGVCKGTQIKVSGGRRR